MYKLSLVVALVFVIGLSCETYAQDSSQKTRELAAALDKTKYKKKDKPNFSIEIYIDIKNEPAMRDAFDYGGNYEAEDSMYSMTLHVERGGAVTGSGHDMAPDGNGKMSFTMKGGSINGALLTATKVYSSGEERPFEAVFVNRTVSSGTNANQINSRDTKFGLGFIRTGTSSDGGKLNTWTNRVFLERR